MLKKNVYEKKKLIILTKNSTTINSVLQLVHNFLLYLHVEKIEYIQQLVKYLYILFVTNKRAVLYLFNNNLDIYSYYIKNTTSALYT